MIAQRLTMRAAVERDQATGEDAWGGKPAPQFVPLHAALPCFVYSQVLNGNAITETAAGSGTVGTKKIGLSQGGSALREVALIARGVSPYNDALPLQYCVPRCYESGNAEPVFRKGGTGASLRLEMTVLEDVSEGVSDDERFGYLIAANAAALS
jgi:hypothetical protein